MKNTSAKIERGFKDFALSIEDFILHFCVREYLCKGTETYYATNLSKGAMKVRAANFRRRDRYEKWYPLLNKELQAVAKPGAPRISIGEEAARFLSKKELDRHVGTIHHYSAQAVRYRGAESQSRQDAYREFTSRVGLRDNERTAKAILTQGEMGSFVDNTLKRIRRDLA